jgi:hypothetical protein
VAINGVIVSIKHFRAHLKWIDVCFPERAKQGSFARNLHGRIHGGPESKRDPRSSRRRGWKNGKVVAEKP